jgi:hypothetical protein
MGITLVLKGTSPMNPSIRKKLTSPQHHRIDVDEDSATKAQPVCIKGSSGLEKRIVVRINL